MLRVCSLLADEATRRRLPVGLTIELAYGESRWKLGAVNPSSGCSGVMQVAPKFWCPRGTTDGCDLVDAGMVAWKHYWNKYSKQGSDPVRAFCHYKSGNRCTPLGLKQAKVTYARFNQFLRNTGRPVE